ncbi:MAG: hypothetical protein KAV00_04150 [Phycisphaerae bacterium]|nr:hypothetical protein [Phycisphaerae bacterium]
MMEEEKKQNVSDPAVGEPTDLAGKSLADALRLSFRLLSIFMVFVVGLFLLTGLSEIESGECGIRLLFGKIQGEGISRVLGKGLAWSLPEPVGQVEKIPTGEQQLEIKDFWPHATAREALIPINERKAPKEGIRPGWDGALLTGDRALVHVKFTCYYRIGYKDNKLDSESVIDHVSGVIDPDEIVRSAVCNAAIRVASTLTVDLILKAGKVGDEKGGDKKDEDEFGEAIRKIGQQRLDAMESGIWLSSVKTVPPIPPLAARAAFEAVNTARQEKDTLIHNAAGEAITILSGAVGDIWKDLVEDPTGRTRSKKTPLLKQYAKARETGEQAKADKLLEEINLLVSDKAKGQASEIIEDARRYNVSIRLHVKSRAKTFEELLPEFNATPKLMISRKWADAKEEILSSKTMLKFYLTPGQKFVLRLGRDPVAARRRDAERLKMQRGQQRENKPGKIRPR